MSNQEENKVYFEKIALDRKKPRGLSAYYWNEITNYCDYFAQEGISVLEVGCGAGELLNGIRAKRKVGIDFSPTMIATAKERFPGVDFHVMEAENIELDETFDLIILSNLIGHLDDVEHVFRQLHKVCHSQTKIIITYYNYLWEPVLKFAEAIGLKTKTPVQNWLSLADINNLLYLSGFDVYRNTKRMILPFNIPLLKGLFNRFLAKLPFFRFFSINIYTFAKPLSTMSPAEYSNKYSVSVVIPARNESGNIENAILRLPKLGKHTEVIFVEGNSTDNTWQKIQEIAKKYSSSHDIKIAQQRKELLLLLVF
mgnify:CR=1 FL=1